MLNSFIIVLREGFESFLLVAVILSYLKKSGQRWLTSPCTSRSRWPCPQVRARLRVETGS